MNEAINNADARTDKGNQYKAENQLIRGDGTDEFADPRNGISNPQTDVCKHARNRICSFASLKNHSFTKLFNMHQPRN